MARSVKNGRYLVEVNAAGYNEGNNVVVMHQRKLNTVNVNLLEFEGLSFNVSMDNDLRRFYDDVKITLTNLDNN